MTLHKNNKQTQSAPPAVQALSTLECAGMTGWTVRESVALACPPAVTWAPQPFTWCSPGAVKLGDAGRAFGALFFPTPFPQIGPVPDWGRSSRDGPDNRVGRAGHFVWGAHFMGAIRFFGGGGGIKVDFFCQFWHWACAATQRVHSHEYTWALGPELCGSLC